MTSNRSAASASYDEPWKSALEQYFEAFLAFFFPQAHGEIDWARGYESLDQELVQVVREAEVGTRFVDKLVKVWLREGEETWLLIHVEVQSQPDSGFAKRMYSYHYRIFDRYDREVVSLAVLGDDQPNWRPQGYHYGRWGCEMALQFPIVKLLDYEADWETLEESENPFAVVVRAHRRTMTTTNDAEGRLRWKLSLIRELYERGYERRDILELFRLIDWMMGLPEDLALQFREDVRQIEEEMNMQYVTSVERIAHQEGRQEGRQEANQEVVSSLLKNRFGELDDELAQVIEPLAQMPANEYTALLLTLSREELIDRFNH